MMAAGLWDSRRRKVDCVHWWQPQRSAWGDLVQLDTLEPDWLVGRGGPARYLVRMIENATSRCWERFVASDGTQANVGVLWEYLERYGRIVDV